MAQFKWSVVCRAVGQREHCTAVVFFPNLLCFTGSWVPSEVQALFMLNIIVYQTSNRFSKGLCFCIAEYSSRQTLAFLALVFRC